MTSTNLKILACITMLIDHIGWMFFPHIFLMRDIGRLSLPIFAFLIAEGSLKTKNINSYLKRLLIFGFISQIPYSVAMYLVNPTTFSLNIFFTLSAGLFLIKLVQLKKYFSFSIFFLIFAILDFIIKYDYGIYGVLLILFSYLFIKKPVLGSVAIIALTILESIRITGDTFDLSEIKFGNQIFAIISLIPIILYKGEHGKKIPKWFFYFFYPVHLAILSVVYILIK